MIITSKREIGVNGMITNMTEFKRAQRLARAAVKAGCQDAWESAMLLLRISKASYWKK